MIDDSQGKPTMPSEHGGVPRLDARPDLFDERDLMYRPSLVQLPRRLPLGDVRAPHIPVLHQGDEGACTGYALATVANRLLHDLAPEGAETEWVSPRMLYRMARKYDDRPGEVYEGSSARGAMKGWMRHGVCADELWPSTDGPRRNRFTRERLEDAARRPLGAYFRLLPSRWRDMHCALHEVGVLYATATVHAGWGAIDPEVGEIPHKGGEEELGDHAFAIVGYDDCGFWLQNSWGPGWGLGGYARITYRDWEAHGTDVWVMRLGVPARRRAPTEGGCEGGYVGLTDADQRYLLLRPHVISVGRGGFPSPNGLFGSSDLFVADLIEGDVATSLGAIPGRKHLLLHTAPGLASETEALAWVDRHLDRFVESNTHPLSFVWKTAPLRPLLDRLLEAAVTHPLLARQAPPAALAGADVGFVENRTDEALEHLCVERGLGTLWDAFKTDARAAADDPHGVAAQVAVALSALAVTDVELHMVAHGAGAIFMAHLLRACAAAGLHVNTCTLTAPACSLRLFHAIYRPALEAGKLGRLHLVTLEDTAERDDRVVVDGLPLYTKSPLSLIANALEGPAGCSRDPFGGCELLGLARDVRRDEAITSLCTKGLIEWATSPAPPPGNRLAVTTHDGFIDDANVLDMLLDRIRRAEPRPLRPHS